MKKIITLDTARLLLRQWRASDREPFAALNANAAVMEFFFATLTREQSDALADKIQKLIARRSWGSFFTHACSISGPDQLIRSIQNAARSWTHAGI